MTEAGGQDVIPNAVRDPALAPSRNEVRDLCVRTGDTFDSVIQGLLPTLTHRPSQARVTLRKRAAIPVPEIPRNPRDDVRQCSPRPRYAGRSPVSSLPNNR